MKKGRDKQTDVHGKLVSMNPLGVKVRVMVICTTFNNI